LGAFRTSPAVSLSVQATKPPLALRRKKLALQYCLKLSANTNNPAYDAVFNSKFKTPMTCRISALRRRMFYLQPFPQFHLGFLNALSATSVYAVTIKQQITQKCSNANSLSLIPDSL